MKGFNLIEEGWIRCEGRAEMLGLRAVLEEAHELGEIVDESPLVVAALHRLLLAILHRNFGPRDTAAWGELWRDGRFPKDKLKSYWERWKGRFDLFDEEYPFYQSGGITEADEPRPIAVLEFQRASGNNATLSDHTTDDRPLALDPAHAARALVAHQTFALGGPVGYLKSREKDSDKRGSDAPPARGAFILLSGGNLFESLMLNLAEYSTDADGSDKPCWERTEPQGRGEQTPKGRVDLFTWQSRRSRLFVKQGGSENVDRVKLAPGFNVPLLWNPFVQESLQAFVIKKNAKAGDRPWFQYRVTGERAAWRDSAAILFGAQGEKRRSLTLEWLAQVTSDEKLERHFACGLQVLGSDTSQQKVYLWRKETLPIRAGMLKDDRCQELLWSALGYSENAAFALNACAERVAKEVLSPSLDEQGGKPDMKRVKDLIKGIGIEPRFWAQLGPVFQTLLVGLGTAQGISREEERGTAENAAFRQWVGDVERAALAGFNDGAAGVAGNMRGLRAVAIAESELRRRLASLRRKFMTGDEGKEGKER